WPCAWRPSTPLWRRGRTWPPVTCTPWPARPRTWPPAPCCGRRRWPWRWGLGASAPIWGGCPPPWPRAGSSSRWRWRQPAGSWCCCWHRVSGDRGMALAQLRRYFVTGLAVLAPILGSLWVLVTVFRLADGLIGQFLPPPLRIPGLGLLLTLLVV